MPPVENDNRQYDDEIDLVELISNLWGERFWIFLTTGIAGILGLLYAFTSTPIYQASAQISQPSTADLVPVSQTDMFKILKEKNFVVAENVHQNFYALNENHPYCQFVIKPKLNKIEKNNF